MNRLTKAQEDYFKHSKIRDNDGNLVTYYHGTNKEFESFDIVKKAPGYWFTEDQEYASQHGENILKVYLNAVKPFDIDDSLVQEYKFDAYFKECYGHTDISDELVLNNTFRDFLKNKGYDSLMWDHDNSKTIVVFQPEQIKSVDNLYPTKSPIFTDNSNEFFKRNTLEYQPNEAQGELKAISPSIEDVYIDYTKPLTLDDRVRDIKRRIIPSPKKQDPRELDR